MESAAVKMSDRISGMVQGWLVGSFAKLNAITAVLWPPSAGAACGDDAVTGPATPASGILVLEGDAVVLGAQRGECGGQDVEGALPRVEPPVRDRRAGVEVVRVHALEVAVKLVVSPGGRGHAAQRDRRCGRSKQQPCGRVPHPRGIDTALGSMQSWARYPGRLDWRPPCAAPCCSSLVLALLAPGSAIARDFPRGFLWGTAIAGFQTEAGGRPANADTHSDWWVWSHDPANIADGHVSGDRVERGPGHWRLFRRDAATGATPARRERLPPLDRVEPAVPALDARRAHAAPARPARQPGRGPPLRRRAARDPARAA